MSIQGFDPNFEMVRQALGSIELFREIYASSAPSAENAAKVTEALRVNANSVKTSNPHAAALFEHVAQGLDLYIGNKTLTN